jgi:hypothetical protein
MAFPKKLKELCTPAFLYFSLSMLGLLISVVQNLGNSRRYNLGMLTARVPSTFLVFIVQIIYILFWTWVLNLMCKDGHKEIAWFLVLIPFILLFLVMGSMMGSSTYEGFEEDDRDLPCPEDLVLNPRFDASQTENKKNSRCIPKEAFTNHNNSCPTGFRVNDMFNNQQPENEKNKRCVEGFRGRR